MEKSLDVTSPEGLKAAAPLSRIHGDPNFWICIAKASCQNQGWMHSTKVALVRGQGLLVQTSTELRSGETGRETSQALVLVPGCYLEGKTYEGQPVYAIRSCTDGDHPPGTFFFNGVRQLPPHDKGDAFGNSPL